MCVVASSLLPGARLDPRMEAIQLQSIPPRDREGSQPAGLGMGWDQGTRDTVCGRRGGEER